MGGGQVLLLSIIPAALKVTRKVTVVAPMGGGLEVALRKQFGAQVTTRNVVLPPLTHGRKGFRDLIRLALGTIRNLPGCISVAMRSQLLYANGPRLFPVLMLASVITRCPCCYHVHINFSSLERFVLVLASRFSTTWKIILNSEETYHKLTAVSPSLAKSNKLLLIENGLSPRYAKMPYINRFAQAPTLWNVVVFGVLRPEKGQDIAVDAAGRLCDVRLNVVGRIGEGAEKWVDNLKRSAPPNVQFFDAVSDIPDFIDEHQIHINLVPSRWEEPFGLVAIEGMASSCVTVVSESGALRRIAERTGAMTFNGSVADLTRVLAELIDGGVARVDSIARGQFQSVMNIYGSERVVGEIKTALEGGLRPARNAEV